MHPFASFLTSSSPLRRETLGYRGVRARPSGIFYAEIRSGDMRLGLGTFDTVEDAARAYVAAAWRLNRPRRGMNFPKVMMMEWAQNFAPRPRVVTEKDGRRNRRQQRRLSIAEMDEHAMAEWRRQFPQDVIDERANSSRKGGRRGRRRGRSKPPIVKIGVRGSKPHSFR
ncbi:Ethylene-responsive transcription factor CRF1 [Hordeum vulgare]|nr:Ethylene-responsive transcription factor CRF1 [Hordeum vulgare]